MYATLSQNILLATVLPTSPVMLFWQHILALGLDFVFSQKQFSCPLVI